MCLQPQRVPLTNVPTPPQSQAEIAKTEAMLILQRAHFLLIQGGLAQKRFDDRRAICKDKLDQLRVLCEQADALVSEMDRAQSSDGQHFPLHSLCELLSAMDGISDTLTSLHCITDSFANTGN